MGVGLSRMNIESGHADVIGGYNCRKGRLVDHRTTRDVYEHSPGPQRRQHAGVDEPLGRLSARTSEDESVSPSGKWRNLGKIPERPGFPMRAAIGEFAAKRSEPRRDTGADTAETNDPHLQIPQAGSEAEWAIRPAPVTHEAIGFDEPSGGCEQQRHCQVCDIVRENVGCSGHGDPSGLSRRQIDPIQPSSEASDDTQRRTGRDQGGRYRDPRRRRDTGDRGTLRTQQRSLGCFIVVGPTSHRETCGEFGFDSGRHRSGTQYDHAWVSLDMI